MDLSAELFIKIVTCPAPEQTDAAGHDQRRESRVGVRSRASIIPLSPGSNLTAMTVQVRDLSAAGMGFLHEQKMALDEQFALVLPRENDTPAVVLCSVAFWQPLARDLFAIGARFRRVLRDGGSPPLPIQLDLGPAPLSAEIEQLHRKAS